MSNKSISYVCTYLPTYICPGGVVKWYRLMRKWKNFGPWDRIPPECLFKYLNEQEKAFARWLSEAAKNTIWKLIFKFCIFSSFYMLLSTQHLEGEACFLRFIYICINHFTFFFWGGGVTSAFYGWASLNKNELLGSFNISIHAYVGTQPVHRYKCHTVQCISPCVFFFST
jgi:hypothetical protein